MPLVWASEAVQPVNQMCLVRYRKFCCMVPWDLPYLIQIYQTDSYAVRLSYHLVHKKYSSSGLYALFVAFVKNIN